MKQTLGQQDRFLIGFGFCVGVFTSIIIYLSYLILMAKLA